MIMPPKKAAQAQMPPLGTINGKNSMEKNTQVDKWTNRLKNNKIVAIIILIFLISTALMKWMNEYSTFKNNFSDNTKTEANIVDSTDNEDVINDDSSRFEKKTIQKGGTKIEKTSPELSTISGRLIDENGAGINGGTIVTENGEQALSNENGFFELKIKLRPEQLKVKISYSKEGAGQKEKYVGTNQKNIVLKL